jgi:glutamate synthase domain-containing protein 3
MKIAPFLSIFLLSACAPKAYKNYHVNTNQYHPALVHQMEQTLAKHGSTDDEEQTKWATDFWNNFEKEFASYKPKKSVIHELFLITQKEHIEITVVGGNWCSDTKTQIPRLCKVLHLAGLDESDFKYFQVDRNKNLIVPEGETAKAKIKPQRVPTVMVKRNGRFAGIVVETPKASWEEDILAFLP